MTNYDDRFEQEKHRFDAELWVHDLPDIFHYWSNKYLKPLVNGMGYEGIDDFFAKEMAKITPHDGPDLRIVSVGSGDCAVEIGIAARLEALGVRNFRFTCLDISDAALARGTTYLQGTGLGDRFTMTVHDFNEGLLPGRFDVVMANQSLHHVVGLESLFASIKNQLATDGVFLVSDIIGRNGHQRWPEAKVLVDEVWQDLPDRYRYNWMLKRQEHQFMDWDCSQEGFEGIRAEEVLPLLLASFSPSVFITWANIIDVFIDRGFGHNFREQSAWDLQFIDRVQDIDQRAMASGIVKPTHLLAAFRLQPCDCLHHPGFSPEDVLRLPTEPSKGASLATHRRTWLTRLKSRLRRFVKRDRR